MGEKVVSFIVKSLTVIMFFFLIGLLVVKAGEIEGNETFSNETTITEETDKPDITSVDNEVSTETTEESNSTDTNDMAGSLTNETSSDVFNASANESSNETSSDVFNASANESSNETSSDVFNASANESSNETSSDVSNTAANESSNETTQVEPVIEEENTTYEDSNSTMVSESNTTVTDNNNILSTYENQTAKVIISKTNEDGELISGAKLQIVDLDGNVVIPAWISDDKPHEVMLPNGTYKLQELEAPEGYVIAEDVEIVVKIEIPEIYAAVDVDPELCDHYQDGQGNYGVVLYYVEIGGVKQEVYCINQQLGTPDGTAYYDGEILDTVDIRNYTRQEVNIDAHYNQDTIDISDQELTNQELYDKLVDIIYHRHKAVSKFSDLTETEIRYITELALKNYTNTGLTEIQRIEKSKAPTNYDKYDFYETSDGKYIWYLYPMYRSYVYLPDAPLGKDIFTTNVGQGTAFGNLARHWSMGHDAKTSETVRAKVARYYELFQYLVGDDNNDGKADHPSDMNIYIYSTESLHKYTYKGVEYTEPYQNLLGITGYFEEKQEIQKEQNVTMTDKYSSETREVTVTKVWDDKDNYEGLRPASVTVILKADNEEIASIELNDDNGWTYTWKDLDVYNKGTKIEYVVEENEVPNYYTEVTGDMVKGFTIINTHFGKGGNDEPPKPSDNPKTADPISLYLLMLMLSIFGLTKISYAYIKNN